MIDQPVNPGITVTLPIGEYQRLLNVEKALANVQHDFTTAIMAINYISLYGVVEASEKLKAERNATLERKDNKLIIKNLNK